MANVGPIQVPSDLSNLKTPSDIVRFLSSFTSQVATQFNNLISTKTAWGVIGLSGTIEAGSENYGVSLVSTGLYYIAFRETFTQRPAATVTTESYSFARVAGASTAGFRVFVSDSGGSLGVNAPFSFIAMGAR